MVRCHVVLFAAVMTLLTAGAPNLAYAATAQRAGFAFGSTRASETSSKDRVLAAATLNEEAPIAARVDVSHQAKELYRSLGGRAQNRPCCVSSAPYRIDCFVQGPKATAMHIYGVHGIYKEWTSLEGKILGEIECVSRDVGIIDIFALDRSAKLIQNTNTKGKWSGWKVVNGPYMEVPSCVARTTSIINCMARKTDNTLQHIGSVDGEWTYEDTFENEKAWSPLKCSAQSGDDFDCFGSGANRVFLYAKWWSGAWTDWTKLSIRGHGRPSVTSWGPTRTDLFAQAVGTKGIVHIPFEDKMALPWEGLGGVFDSPPECVSPRVGQIYCFAVGERSHLFRNIMSEDGWTGWARLSGEHLETPSCIVVEEDKIICTGRKRDKEVIQLIYETPNLS